MIAAIVLAAGESRRMGKPKQLMPWGEGTILEQVIGNLLGSRLDEIIVVLGCQAETIAQRIAHKPIKIVVNPGYRQGMSSSIRAGLSQVPETAAIMIHLGDQPLIGREIINKLIENFLRGERGIIVPTCKSMKGHPVIFGAKYRGELLRLEGDVGGRGIIEAHPQDVLEVQIDSEAIISDIDSINDYQSQSQPSAERFSAHVRKS